MLLVTPMLPGPRGRVNDPHGRWVLGWGITWICSRKIKRCEGVSKLQGHRCGNAPPDPLDEMPSSGKVESFSSQVSSLSGWVFLSIGFTR